MSQFMHVSKRFISSNALEEIGSFKYYAANIQGEARACAASQGICEYNTRLAL